MKIQKTALELAKLLLAGEMLTWYDEMLQYKDGKFLVHDWDGDYQPYTYTKSRREVFQELRRGIWDY